MQNIVLISCTVVFYVLIITRKQMPTKRRTATKVVIKTGEQTLHFCEDVSSNNVVGMFFVCCLFDYMIIKKALVN